MLKDGRTVATGLLAADTPTPDLIKLMTGRSIEYVFPRREEPPDQGAPVLEVDGPDARRRVHDVSFSVRAGEIVGLAGLVGSGRSEILETIYGARKQSAGKVTVDGKSLRKGSVTAAVVCRRRAGPGGTQEPGHCCSSSR